MRPNWKWRSASGKRGDTVVPTSALRVQSFCGVVFAEFGMESDQGGDIFKTRSTVCGFFAYGKRFIVATTAWKIAARSRFCGFAIEPESLSSIDVV